MVISKEDIAKVTEQMFAEAKNGNESPDTIVERGPQAVDVYQENLNNMRKEMRKVYPRGASTLTKKIAEEALEGLARQKKRAEVDSDYWRERGDKERARMVKDQYMEEHFIPSVEMVIISSNPDEVLNAKDILSEFDNLTFEYGPGYTASYIRTAYGNQLGNASNLSDGYIRDEVQRLRYLTNSDQIRSANMLAKKLKKEIDEGQHTSSDDDYEIILRVATID